MTKIYPALKLLVLVCFTLAVSASVQAQATRTWVSGVGDDVNPCSRTAPCKTFAGAISKTAANGEIDALDPGGFGAVTITKSITIDGTKGAGFGSILSAGVNGVIVNDGATGTPNTIIVTLRNLSINGANTGTNGINFIAGKTVNVEDCQIFGFPAAASNGAGIRVALTATGGTLNVNGTSIFNCRLGISVTTTVGTVAAVVSNSTIKKNTSDGLFLQTGAQATVTDSLLSSNGGAGLSLAISGGQANVERSTINHNLIGFFLNAGSTLRLGHSMILTNGTNFINNGTVVSFNNNDADAAIPGVVTNAGPR